MANGSRRIGPGPGDGARKNWPLGASCMAAEALRSPYAPTRGVGETLESCAAQNAPPSLVLGRRRGKAVDIRSSICDPFGPARLVASKLLLPPPAVDEYEAMPEAMADDVGDAFCRRCASCPLADFSPALRAAASDRTSTTKSAQERAGLDHDAASMARPPALHCGQTRSSTFLSAADGTEAGAAAPPADVLTSAPALNELWRANEPCLVSELRRTSTGSRPATPAPASPASPTACLKARTKSPFC